MAFADVTSANVVGYSKLQLNAGGKNMMGSCFVNVGEETMRLTDLKVTGYENSEYYLQNVYEFTVTFQRRGNDGMPYATYAYSDTTEDMETWVGGKWYDAMNGGTEITTENDVYLKAGSGLWFDTPTLEDCSGFYLTNSGEVLKGDFGFELNAGGKIGVCNMMPTPTTLTKLEIHGYEKSEWYLQNVYEFTVTMQSLGNDGMPLATYAYSDTTEDMETWVGGKWYDAMHGGIEITSENDVTINPGEGFWADTPELEDCTQFLMVFPKCLAE